MNSVMCSTFLEEEIHPIHKANCWTLRRKTDEVSRASIEKVCSPDLKELSNEATSLRGSTKDWSLCKICFKATSGTDVGTIKSSIV